MAAGVKAMTILLEPSELGLISLIIAITGLFALMLVNPVGMFINRFLHVWVEENIFKYVFFRLLTYLILVGFISIPILAIIKEYVDALNVISLAWVVLLISGSLIFNSVVQTLIPSLNALGNRKAWAFMTIAWVVTNFIFSVAAVLLFDRSAEFWLVGALLSNVLFSFLSYRIFFIKFSTSRAKYPLDLFSYSDLAKFSVPIAFSVISIWIQFQGYRLYLVDQIGLEELGFFFAGYSIAVWTMGAIEQIAMTAYQPDLYRDSHSSDTIRSKMAWSRYSDQVIPCYTIGCAALVFLANDLVKILLSDVYHTVGMYVIVGAFAELARILLLHINLLFHLEMNTKSKILPIFAGALLAVLITLLLAPLFGIVVSPIISTCITIPVAIYIIKKINFKKQIVSFSIFYATKIFIVSVLAGLAGLFIANIIELNAVSLSGSIARVLFFGVPCIGFFLLMAVFYKSKR